MHLANAFIQSNVQAIHFCQYVCSLGIEPTTFRAANAMLYHWATGTLPITQVNISILFLRLYLYISRCSYENQAEKRMCTPDTILYYTILLYHILVFLFLFCKADVWSSYTYIYEIYM